ncbi:unnamed protein product [Allacma fusca]|uniref:Thaumatin-like protein n=1 Tax=Allacma fusca TaxID=39272 RepID=A0A8J2JRU0_9HEXA|nr:unnamed protein product [Allacma fusca]
MAKSILKLLFLTVIAVLLKTSTTVGHQMTVANRCNQVIWVGTFGDNEIPANGGFRLNPGESNKFEVRYKWLSGRIWGRTGCDANGRNCESGDCGEPNCRGRTVFDAVTLAEFGLDSDFMGLDFWDISQVDGHNLPMSIRPVPGTVKNGNKCYEISCRFDFNVCPNNFKQWGKNNNLAGCKSACSATREDRFCCPENKGYNRDNCPQPTDESRLFKNQCPDAYSYAYDDDTSVFACENQTPGSSSYEITFCP